MSPLLFVLHISSPLFHEILCFCKGIYLAYIHEAEVSGDVAVDGLTVADAEVEVDDAELIGPLAEITEKRGTHVMNAGKGKFVITVRILNLEF